MKAKHALAILILGFCFDFVGALFKILHTREAVFGDLYGNLWDLIEPKGAR
jgi:hypothetical protein